MKKLEQQLADCESALVEESVVSQERKLQAERTQYQVAHIYSLITWQCCLSDCVLFQVAELQAEVDNLKVKYTSLSRQTKVTQDEKDVEVQKVFCLFV